MSFAEGQPARVFAGGGIEGEVPLAVVNTEEAAHVGVDADGERVMTILEEAQKAGMSTGVVTTSQVTDATPAAFAAHVPDRADHGEIARQYVQESRPDVILSGGGDFWHSEGDPTEGGKDSGRSLVEQAKSSGHEYITDPDGLERTESPKILGLFADGAMFQEGIEGEGVYDPAVPLPVMTDKAIETLSQNDKGFFLLVEEQAIDAMSHENNAELTLEAGKQLDERHPGADRRSRSRLLNQERMSRAG